MQKKENKIEKQKRGNLERRIKKITKYKEVDQKCSDKVENILK